MDSGGLGSVWVPSGGADRASTAEGEDGALMADGVVPAPFSRSVGETREAGGESGVIGAPVAGDGAGLIGGIGGAGGAGFSVAAGTSGGAGACGFSEAAGTSGGAGAAGTAVAGGGAGLIGASDASDVGSEGVPVWPGINGAGSISAAGAGGGAGSAAKAEGATDAAGNSAPVSPGGDSRVACSASRATGRIIRGIAHQLSTRIGRPVDQGCPQLAAHSSMEYADNSTGSPLRKE